MDNQIRNFVNGCQQAPARIPLALGLVVQRLSGGAQVAPVCLLGPEFQYTTFFNGQCNICDESQENIGKTVEGLK